MAFAVSLWFDDETEQYVRECWRVLHEENISSIFEGPYRPHVTLAVHDKLEVESFTSSLEELLSKTQVVLQL